MAPPFSLHSLLLQRGDTKEVHGGLSCEIVSDLCPNPFSHDWHVQPSCQRPNRLPPERRAFRSRRTRFFLGEPNKSESGCPRNPSTISSARNPVNLHIPQHFHVFSTWEICSETGEWGACLLESCHSERSYREESASRGAQQHATIWPSALDLQQHRFLGARISRNTAAEDRKLRKDPNGGPCFEGTLQKPTSCFRIKSRGRDD